MRQIESFSIGSVLDATFRVFGRNFIPFFLLGLIILVPTAYLSNWAMTRFVLVSPEAFDMASLFITLAITSLVSVLSYTLVQACFACAVFHTLKGDQQSLMDSLALGVRVLPFTLLASIVSTLIISFGILLLIVPGIIFMFMYFLVIPVAAIERKYPIAALSRSAQLTKGHRGKIFGLFLLLIVGGGILGALFGGVSALLNPDLAENLLSNPSSWVNWLFAVIVNVSTAVVYYDLRLLKEDMDSESVAEVFH